MGNSGKGEKSLGMKVEALQNEKERRPEEKRWPRRLSPLKVVKRPARRAVNAKKKGISQHN